jgi:hypothetical protein
MTTTTSAPDQRGTADAAADEGKHVAGVAAEEARSVADDARDQARQLLDETLHQVNEHGSVQRDSLVELLRGLSNDLHQMADKSDTNGVASSLVQQGADRADQLRSRLDGHELTELVDGVRDFARRRPGAFLMGALAAGLVAGRFGRGAKAAHAESDSDTSQSATGHVESHDEHTPDSGSHPAPSSYADPAEGRLDPASLASTPDALRDRP